MNENINLCEILKGHKGETFYSRCFGNVILIDHIDLKFKASKEHDEIILEYYHKGNYSENGEQDLFPSKNQQDWNKWIEEQNSKVPKTWNNIKDKYIYYFKVCNDLIELESSATVLSPIEKSALALLKIHQLIDAGYGGNVTTEEWLGNINNPIFVIIIDPNMSNFVRIDSVEDGFEHGIYRVAFHTREQAEEFLKYPENIQLLKDYFMI